jgi:hypothetical protein
LELNVADPRRVPEPQSSSDPSDLFARLFSEDDEPGFARVSTMKCPLCSQPNPENHKYCGFCGVPLHAPLLSPEPAKPSDFSPPSLDELQFLRNRDGEESGGPRDRRGWLYLVIGIAVLLAGFAAFERYYEPDSEPRAAAFPAGPVSQPPVETTTPPQNQPAPESQAAQPAEPKPAAEPTAIPAQKVIPASRITPAASPVEDGSQELTAAQHNLSPTNPARNPAMAASLLWKSVGKGNVEAEVTLADLYLRGEGVSRSCEQARLLLRTAAGKGSPDALTKLRTLQCK